VIEIFLTLKAGVARAGVVVLDADAGATARATCVAGFFDGAGDLRCGGTTGLGVGLGASLGAGLAIFPGISFTVGGVAGDFGFVTPGG
jgi:hypothetical protein